MQLTEIVGDPNKKDEKQEVTAKSTIVRIKRPDGTVVEVSEEDAIKESQQGGRRLLVD